MPGQYIFGVFFFFFFNVGKQRKQELGKEDKQAAQKAALSQHGPLICQVFRDITVGGRK